jgi:translation initiation factor 1 (eIF-1/SUI1)
MQCQDNISQGEILRTIKIQIMNRRKGRSLEMIKNIDKEYFQFEKNVKLASKKKKNPPLHLIR